MSVSCVCSRLLRLQLYGRRVAWDDPARWVTETFPWRSNSQHPDWPALLKLRPEDVGLDVGSTSKEGAPKQNTQSDSDADPLVRKFTYTHTHTH